MLFLKALFAFLVLPGIVAFAVPLFLLKPADTTPFWPGALIVGAGTALLVRCVREFYVAGRGTLAPWSPPKQLVTSGPYRWSRNPMYIGVLLILVGWAVGFRSRGLGVYAAIVAIAFHVRVLVAEEPWQSRTFGEDWNNYKSAVPRWLGPL